jgi:hypothetical protein
LLLAVVAACGFLGFDGTKCPVLVTSFIYRV